MSRSDDHKIVRCWRLAFVSRSFFAISLIVINLVSRSTVAMADESVSSMSSALDSWFSDIQIGYDEIIRSCVDRCSDQDKYYQSMQALECGSHKVLCSVGCNSWKLAIESTCRIACKNDTWENNLSPCDLSCIAGCNQAVLGITNHMQQFTDSKASPVPVDTEANATYLTLSWPVEEEKCITHRLGLQQRNSDGPTTWSYLSNTQWLDNCTCVIQELTPYTNYTFRVTMRITNDSGFIHFAESQVLHTASSEIHLEPLEITSIMTVDHDKIAVLWKPRPIINSFKYKVVAEHSGSEDYSSIEKIVDLSSNYVILQSLKPKLAYDITIKMIDPNHTEYTVATEQASIDEDFGKEESTINKFMVASQKTIQSCSVIDQNLTCQHVYTNDHDIISFDVFIRTGKGIVADSSGLLFQINLNGSNIEREALAIPKIVKNAEVLQVSIDRTNDVVYMMLEVQEEENARSWEIYQFKFPFCCKEPIVKDLISKPITMRVDSVNGFLFWLTETGIFRLKLDDKSMSEIYYQAGLTTFAIDSNRLFLTAFSRTSQKFLTITYDGSYSFDVDRLDSLSEEVLDIFSHDSNLYWIDDEFLHINQLKISLQDQFQILIPFVSPQPYCRKVRQLKNIQALLASDRAKLTWNQPEIGYLQIKARTSYELEIKSGEESNTIRDIQSTAYTVKNLAPNTEYWFRIRTYCSSEDDAIGSWSDWLQRKTMTASEKRRRFIWATSDGLRLTDEIGESVEVLSNRSLENVAWINHAIYSLNGSDVYRVDNLDTDIRGMFSIGSIAYDWNGGKLYFVDTSKDLVIRSDLNGINREILPLLGVKHLILDPENGYLYHSTTSKVEGCRLDGLMCVTYFSTGLYSGVSIIGPALDLNGGRIFWMTQVNGSPKSELFSAQLIDRRNSVNDKSVVLEGVPPGSWLTYSSGRLVWPTTRTSVIFADVIGENQYYIGKSDGLGVATYGMALIDDSEKLQNNSWIPEAVLNSTIKIDGLWNDFNITWQPEPSEQEFKIWYSLRIGNRFLTAMESSVRYQHSDLPPYTPVKLWITTHSPWNTGLTTSAEILTPSASPSAPKRLRAFVKPVIQPAQGIQNLFVYVRWEAPLHPNGPIIQYTVDCLKDGELVSSQSSKDLMTVFKDLQENVTYTFHAQAHTSASKGNLSDPIEVTVNAQYPLLPEILIAMVDQIAILDMDLNTTESITQTNGSAKFIAFIREEELVVWFETSGRLMLSFPGEVGVLCHLESEVQALTLDWISRIVYWAQSDLGGGSTIHFIDLNQYKDEPLSGELLISNPNPIRDLVMLPMSQTLIWLELDGTISGWNIRDHTELNLFLGTNMTFRNLYPAGMDKGQESLLLVEEDGTIYLLDLHSETCKPLKIGADSKNLHLAWDSGFIYALKNQSIRAYNQRRQVLEYMVHIEGISDILSTGLQPYPESRCLRSDYSGQVEAMSLLVPQFINFTENSLELRLPKIQAPSDCGFTIPGLKYTVFVKEPPLTLQSFEPHLNVTKLKPFTNYTIQLGISNYYSDQLGLPLEFGPEVNVSTAPGTPSQPRNITVYAVSPRDGLLEWMPPEVLNNDRVWYEIHWRTETQNNGAVHRFQEIIPETEDEWNSFLLSSLRPNQTYSVWMKVFSTKTAFNETSEFDFRTFSEPEDLTFLNATAYNMTLSWNTAQNVTSVFLLYSPTDVDDAVSVNITSNTRAYLVESLQPKTRYSFQLKLFYSNSLHPYVWPVDNRFVFETLGDRPTAPGVPLIEHIKGEVYKIFWDPARNNGAPIEQYSLEALQSTHPKRVRRSHYYAQEDDRQVSNKTLARLGQLPWANEIEPIQDKWIPYCNGTETNCIITELHTKRLLMFRVRAKNSFGWGPYSHDSEMISEPFILPRKRDTLVFAIIAPITIVSTCVSLIVLFRYVHGRRRHAKKLLYESRPSIWGLDVATLQQVARSRNFSQTSSMLYTGKPLTDGDIALLPQISRGQITMQRFLGSGAFGEVYEGMVTYSDDGSQDRVAIKTLRKGASEQEKTELLQEAHLMSHFKHENIVKLIGVCFDLDSICIIMELMEGGDLQSFLRHARPNLSKRGMLSLLDLIGMCLDVCTGCRYLEDLHFLHRDLACRNCLVSSVDPEYRVVKIGDFGLARDIYKSDYYRKEGEGLLPVRWMAPECLVDGVFTSQSDIWSFGILLWEILSLGQQPYPAQSNLEVLNFVKEGGRLQQPDECPERLYKLMLQCWSHNPEDRPTFQQCLNELLAMKIEALNIKHSKDYEGGFTNMSYSGSDGESMSKISISSTDPSTLNTSFVDESKSNQRSPTIEDGSELTTFTAPIPIESDTNDVQPKRKSVHYVNDARSKF